MGSSNIQTLYSRDVWSCIEKDTVTTRSNDGAHLPVRGATNCFTIQPIDSQGIAWCTECCSCGMEHADFCNIACGWTVRKEGSSVKCWVLIIEEEVPDKVVEVDLSYMLPVSAQFLWFQILTLDKVSIPTITHFPGNQDSPPSFSFYFPPSHMPEDRTNKMDYGSQLIVQDRQENYWSPP